MSVGQVLAALSATVLSASTGTLAWLWWCHRGVMQSRLIWMTVAVVLGWIALFTFGDISQFGWRDRR